MEWRGSEEKSSLEYWDALLWSGEKRRDTHRAGRGLAVHQRSADSLQSLSPEQSHLPLPASRGVGGGTCLWARRHPSEYPVPPGRTVAGWWACLLHTRTHTAEAQHNPGNWGFPSPVAGAKLSFGSVYPALSSRSTCILDPKRRGHCLCLYSLRGHRNSPRWPPRSSSEH